MMGYKAANFYNTFSLFATVPEHDKQTGGTSCSSIVHAMHIVT